MYICYTLTQLVLQLLGNNKPIWQEEQQSSDHVYRVLQCRWHHSPITTYSTTPRCSKTKRGIINAHSKKLRKKPTKETKRELIYQTASKCHSMKKFIFPVEYNTKKLRASTNAYLKDCALDAETLIVVRFATHQNKDIQKNEFVDEKRANGGKLRL